MTENTGTAETGTKKEIDAILAEFFEKLKKELKQAIQEKVQGLEFLSRTQKERLVSETGGLVDDILEEGVDKTTDISEKVEEVVEGQAEDARGKLEKELKKELEEEKISLKRELEDAIREELEAQRDEFIKKFLEDDLDRIFYRIFGLHIGDLNTFDRTELRLLLEQITPGNK